MATLSAQQHELLGRLKDEADRSLALQAALDKALEEGRRRDALVLRNRQLESARHFDRVAQVGGVVWYGTQDGGRRACCVRKGGHVGEG